MQISVFFEDNALMVINKPPGIVVNRAQSVKTETIQEWAEQKLEILTSKTGFDAKRVQNSNSEDQYNIVEEFFSRAGIVHRIDKETSGLLILAKTPEAFGKLKQQFMERAVKKTYLAIIRGRMPSQEGEINAPIDRLPWNKEQFGVVASGKESLTLYKVIHEYQRKMKKGIEQFQLLECYPKTGRTHQIRVHLKYLNRPILGDYLYAGRKTARDDRIWVPRVMLHANKITFSHPVTSLTLHLEAPMPEDMLSVLAKISTQS